MTFLPGPEPENEQAVFCGGRLQEIRYCSALALTSACGPSQTFPLGWKKGLLSRLDRK
jgi:hypothetical protein